MLFTNSGARARLCTGAPLAAKISVVRPQSKQLARAWSSVLAEAVSEQNKREREPEGLLALWTSYTKR